MERGLPATPLDATGYLMGELDVVRARRGRVHAAPGGGRGVGGFAGWCAPGSRCVATPSTTASCEPSICALAAYPL